MKETTIDMVSGEDYILYYTSEKKWANKLRKQIEEHPGAVEVKVDTGNMLAVKLPASWFKAPAPPKRSRTLTKEEKSALAARLEVARAAKNNR